MSIPFFVFALVALTAAVAVTIAVRHNSNKFVAHLASAHRDTWIKLGKPKYESTFHTTTDFVILPYLYRQRFRKFDDAYLNKLGKRIRRLHFAFIGVMLTAVAFVVAL